MQKCPAWYCGFPLQLHSPRQIPVGSPAVYVGMLGEDTAICRHVIRDHPHAGQGGIGLYGGLHQLPGEAHLAEAAIHQNAAQAAR